MPNSPAYDRSVFLNVPFDDTYQTLFDSMTFAVLGCGHVLRCGLERDDSAQVRFEKIIHLIRGCRLGIHDLSRVDLSSPGGLPRFNMPIEAGIWLGARRFGDSRQRRKVMLILDADRGRYRNSASDLAGQDIKAHHNDPAHMIAVIREFMAANTRSRLPGATALRRMFQEWIAAFPAACAVAHLEPGETTFLERRRMMADWLRRTYPGRTR